MISLDLIVCIELIKKEFSRMMQAEKIEERFIFKKQHDDISYISDCEGQVLGFNKLDNGHNVIFTKDLEGIEVAIEHCPDGTKIFHMEKDSKGLPAMHEFKPDGSELIYLFDAQKRLEKMIEMKNNGDKVTYWFSSNGDVASQEQRQKGGTLFRMKTKSSEALVWLHVDGEVEAHGEKKLISHLYKVFSRFLDGFAVEVS